MDGDDALNDFVRAYADDAAASPPPLIDSSTHDEAVLLLWRFLLRTRLSIRDVDVRISTPSGAELRLTLSCGFWRVRPHS
jgi:hypothetical protein